MTPLHLTADPLDRTRFPAEPWRFVETEYSGEDLGTTETLFAVGNGYLGMRGNPPEGREAHTHGTFINGFHETWDIGKRVRICSTRMVSFTERHLALMSLEVTLLEGDAPIVVSSQIINRQDGKDEYHVRAAAMGEGHDPRKASDFADRVLEPQSDDEEQQREEGQGADVRDVLAHGPAGQRGTQRADGVGGAGRGLEARGGRGALAR